MSNENRRPQATPYQPESWREDNATSDDLLNFHSPVTDPSAREQCRLLDLLGRINYKILSGNRVYVEVDGIVYKTLYGGYWRSVFTGIEHYLLRCEQVSGNSWTKDDSTSIDLPIAYSNDGWTARGSSLSFILNQDLAENKHRFVQRLRRFRFVGR
jgi:hypothetical protein